MINTKTDLSQYSNEELMRIAGITRPVKPAIQRPIPAVARQSQVPLSLAHRIAALSPIQAVLGAGDIMARNFSLGLLHPHFGTGEAYQLGKAGGNILSYLAATRPLLGTAALATRAIPVLGRAIRTTEAFARPLARLRALGPKARTRQILSDIGDGNPISKNPASIADDIRNAYLERQNIKNSIYNPIKKAVGNENIYQEGLGLPDSQYKGIDADVIKKYSDDAKVLHKKFISEPTVNNAHELQSQLGTEAKSLETASKRMPLSQAERNERSAYYRGRGALLDDIQNFLQRKSPLAAEQYNAGRDYMVDEINPFRTKPKLMQMATGKLEEPKESDILGSFNTQEGKELANKLGDNFKEKIAFQKLGKFQRKPNARLLLQAADKLEKDFEPYKTPNLNRQLEELRKAFVASKIAKRMGLGLLTGIGIHHLLGGL